MIVYDTVVIGSGPAGISAALTCASQGLQCLLLSDRRGGKLRDILHLTNWFGDVGIDGKQLTARLYGQLEEQMEYVTVRQSSVRSFDMAKDEHGKQLFTIQTEERNEDQVLAKTLIVATGTVRRQLGIPGERALLGRGVSYCATCDIPYFRGKTVALVGDDTSSVETAYELAQQAKRVYLFTSFDSDAPRTNNVRIIVDAKIEKILGSNQVTGIIYTDNASGESVQLAVEGVFIESDAVGNSLLVRHAVDTSPAGFITVDHVTMATSAAGIFAAGDVTNGDYKQVVFAMADGAKAALSVKKYVNVKEIV